jgi:hypothetical protein
MKKTIIVASLALMAGAFSSSILTRAYAAQAISQQVYYTALKGNYAFASLSSSYNDYPSAGSLTFDGKGNVTGIMNLNNDGDVCQGMTLVGTYTVNPGLATGSAQMSLTSVSTGDCTLAGNGDTLPVAFSIAASGNVLYLEEMDSYTDGFFSASFGYWTALANHY